MLSSRIENAPIQKKSNTDFWNNFLVFLYIISLPIQEDIPTLLGFSISAVIAILMLIKIFSSSYSNRLIAVLKMPLTKALFAYIIVCSFLESLHPSASYGGLLRIFSNYVGAICIATIITNEMGIKVLIFAYIISAIYLSIFLYFYGWEIASISAAQTFSAANNVRDELLSNVPITQNPNYMSYTIGVSIVVLLILILKKNQLLFIKPSFSYIIITALSIGLLLTMSRTGIIVMIITILFIMYYFHLFSFERLIIIVFAGMLLYTVAPDSVKTRLKISNTEEMDEFGNQFEGDSRNVTFDESLTEVTNNFFWGTGEGNLWGGEYLKHSKLVRFNEEKNTYKMSGSHNLIFQNIIQWGVIALFFFLAIFYNVLKIMPSRNNLDFNSIIVLVFNFAAIILMFFDHIGSNKEYSIAFSLAMTYDLLKKGKRQKLAPATI